LNYDKWLIPLSVAVGLVAVIGGGFLFNKWAQEVELRGIINDTEVAVDSLEPVAKLIWETALITVDWELVEANVVLADALEDAKKAGDFARQKDLVNARYYYRRSVAKLDLFAVLFADWMKKHSVPSHRPAPAPKLMGLYFFVIRVNIIMYD